MIKKFIPYLRELNRKRNYLTRDIKLLLTSFKLRRTTFDLSKIKKITIQACKNGLGDAVIISGLPKILKTNGYHITLLTKNSNAFLFESNPNIDEIICINNPLNKEQIKRLKSLECDLFIDPNNKTSYSNWIFKVIKYIKPKHTIGINYSKIYRLYDSIIDYTDYTSHFSKRFIYILQKLNINIDEKEYKYDLYYPDEYDLQVQKLLSQYSNKLVCIFNPFASSERRSFSEKQTKEIINLFSKYANVLTIIVGISDRINKLPSSQNVLINQLTHFYYTVALIKHCDLVLSVDTSIVHLSNAYNKHLISIYSSEIDTFNPNYKNNNVYKPNYNKAIQIIAPSNAAQNLDIKIVKQHLDRLVNLLSPKKS